MIIENYVTLTVKPFVVLDIESKICWREWSMDDKIRILKMDSF